MSSLQSFDGKQSILTALWEINSFFEDPTNTKNWFFNNFNNNNGLCYHLADFIFHNDQILSFVLASDVANAARQYWKEWPFYSDDPKYPIPGGDETYNDITVELWTGEQGEYRIQLIQFLIQQISKDLNI